MEYKRVVKSAINTFFRKDKVAWLHTGRCGSTVLESLLNQNRYYHGAGEPFERKMGQGPFTRQEVVDIVKYREKDTYSRVFSFSTKYPQGMHLSEGCVNMSISDYVELLRSLGYQKFVVITRANHLKRVFSIEKGRQTGQWHTTNRSDQVMKFHIPIHDFDFGSGIKGSILDYFEVMDQEKRIVLDAIGKNPYLELIYEKDIEKNPVGAYWKVIDFIELTGIDPEVKLRKTNPYPLREVVDNFDEVEQFLSGTSYQWMLNG